MDQVKAMELVNKALTGLQRLRSMSVEELTRLGWDKETVESVIADLIPWMLGDKGDAFLRALAIVSDCGSVTGQELYNFMAILHLLDKTLLMMLSAVSETMYPEPRIDWLVILGF